MYTAESKTTLLPGRINNSNPGRVPFFQRKLTINVPGDQYEQEADRMAEQVMRMSVNDQPFFKPSPLSISRVQKKCKNCEEEEKLQRKEEPGPLKRVNDFEIQRKCSHCEEEEKVQMKEESSASAGTMAPPVVHDVISSGGQSLDTGTRNFMESRFGYDFGDVQIHNDSLAHQSSAEISALAYTHGIHVVFGRGQYQPNTNIGKQLLAHELVHVVQQKEIPGIANRKTIQRQTKCDGLMTSQTPYIPGIGDAAHSAIEFDFIRKGLVGTLIGNKNKGIPGASAAKFRTQGLCGGDSSMVPPQIIGGKAGMGYPDIARINGRKMEVVEIKPAAIVCYIDGETQLENYINEGNASDTPQKQWRKSKGIDKVVRMPMTTYSPVSYDVGAYRMQVDWCTDGLILYSLTLKIGPPVPPPVPVEHLVKILAAALAAKGLWSLIKLSPGGRAAALAAIAILLVSGKAEAKIGLDGDDPVEALFKAMEKDGVKIPDDIRKKIEGDPELKKMLDEAVSKGGDLSEVQKKIAEQYSKFIYEHIDEFSKDEIRELLKATDNFSSSMPNLDVTSIKKSLNDKKKKLDDADSKEVDKAYPELSEGTRQWDPLESTCRHASLSIL